MLSLQLECFIKIESGIFFFTLAELHTPVVETAKDPLKRHSAASLTP